MSCGVRRVTIDDLNRKDRDGFVKATGWVFEHSPWVAERAWTRRPFSSVDALHDAMVSEVASASAEEQLRLLRAHPDLGAFRQTPETPEISVASAAEQDGAGLNALTAAELSHLIELNSAYRHKFGFPFVYAVKGSTPRHILNALEQRMLSTREEEFREALQQVYRIARVRLEGAVL